MEHNPYQAPIMAGPPTSHSGGVSSGSYEFDAVENQAIAKMGRRARWWGVICLITGAAGMLMLIAVGLLSERIVAETEIELSWIMLGLVALVPVVVTHIVIAFSYMGAGSSMLAVVKTEGNDVELLMQSLRKLGTAFMVEFIVGALALAIGLAAGVAISTSGVDVSDDFDFDD